MTSQPIPVEKILADLKSRANPENVAGMARYGIRPKKALGVPLSYLRKEAKQIGQDHCLALDLWKCRIHEARLLACLIADPLATTSEQMEAWVLDFDSWDICDCCCNNLFDKTPFAYQKVVEWSSREEEFVKRAAFSLLVSLSVHDKDRDDTEFEAFLPLIRREASDDRNYVKKAVNWALRAIGKRSPGLNCKALECAHEIRRLGSRSARWISADAIRELTREKTRNRIGLRSRHING